MYANRHSIDLSSDGVDVLINDIKEHLVELETINNLLREENQYLRRENIQNQNNLKVEKTNNAKNVKNLETKIKKLQTENQLKILRKPKRHRSCELKILRKPKRHRSCETQLIKTVNDLAKSMNHGEQIDSILLDFSKAFDKVCRRKLLLKLEHYGIRGRNLQWIKKFLKNRTQKVAVAGVASSVSAITSGVPQGTVLGRLLFLIYINDLPSTISSAIGLFADDTYIYRSIRNIDDSKILQEDLRKLMQWEQSWSMEFHPDKCKVLRITNKRKVIKYRYLLHNVNLKEVSNAEYLGVTMNTRLSWKKHVHEICGKANQTRQFLRRNLVACKPETKLQCYKTFIRPIVEYSSSV